MQSGQQRNSLSFIDLLKVDERVEQAYEPLLPEMLEWYHGSPASMNDEDLFFAIEHRFSDRLIEQVCKQLGFFDGACVFIAMVLVRQRGERRNEYLPRNTERRDNGANGGLDGIHNMQAM